MSLKILWMIFGRNLFHVFPMMAIFPVALVKHEQFVLQSGSASCFDLQSTKKHWSQFTREAIIPTAPLTEYKIFTAFLLLFFSMMIQRVFRQCSFYILRKLSSGTIWRMKLCINSLHEETQVNCKIQWIISISIKYHFGSFVIVRSPFDESKIFTFAILLLLLISYYKILSFNETRRFA